MSSPSDPPVNVRVGLLHPLRAWVESLESALEERWGIEVVSASTELAWVRNVVRTGRTDVLVLYVDPEHESEVLTLVEELAHDQPRTKVVMIGESCHAGVLGRAVRLGVCGWVDPGSSMEHLVNVIQGVARGEAWMPPRLMAGVLESLVSTARVREQADSVLAGLSTREIEVLGCLVEGMSRQEIAAHFSLSPHTVRTHINNLMRKLGVHSTLSAVATARRVGITGPARVG